MVTAPRLPSIIFCMTYQSPTILITRPLGQHELLVAACQQIGFKVNHLPCLSIDPVYGAQELQKKVQAADTVLFTSRNAVLNAHTQLPLPWQDKQVHAIGSATAQALAELRQGIQFDPLPPFNSESYLQQLESIPAQKLLIVKGVGGRDLIASVLAKRGWTLQTADVYQRSIPTLSNDVIDGALQASELDIISITSNEALENLVTLAQNHWQSIKNLPLVVNSIRSRELASELGFTQTAIVSSQAGDQGQLVELRQWFKNH